MLFNSIGFLFFFPCVVIIHFLLPTKLRWVWLLSASYFFYGLWSVEYLGLICLSTIITYSSGILISKYFRFRKLFLLLSLIINLSILFFYKYFNFFSDSAAYLINTIGFNWEMQSLNVLLPVGISFYTFQALSYTIDVYRRDISPEFHLGKYALFVSFFPQLVAGPIEKSKNLLPQFSKKINITYSNFSSGLYTILWGLLKKVVIADRLGVFVNEVYNTPSEHPGVILLVATVLFSFQIYCDFSSYTDIAIGAARIMGYDLMTNFKRPYFAKSIPEFWRRWHISLGTWFKEYLYIPLGGNKKGKAQMYFNIFLVFLLSGLWHGASWNFVIWGTLHGIYQVIDVVFRDKIVGFFKFDVESINYKIVSVISTFSLVAFAWVFFRANTVQDSFLILKRIFVNLEIWALFDGTLFTNGLDGSEFFIAFVGIISLLAIDYKSRTGSIYESIQNLGVVFRWCIYILLVLFIVVYGIYGEYEKSAFIYFQF